MRNVEGSMVATIAAIALLSGCSQTYAVKDGSSVTVSSDGTKIAVKSSYGSTVAGEINQDYPATFPVPLRMKSKALALPALSEPSKTNRI